MSVFLDDCGDKYDKVKWDFDESDIPVYHVGKYPYKATTKQNALVLNDIRMSINRLCANINNNRHIWSKTTKNQEYIDGVEIFLSIHMEQRQRPETLPEPFYHIALNGHPTSRYLLSEMPSDTDWRGLSKPKMRYIDRHGPSVGKDKNGRALYRDIFLKLDTNSKTLEKLVVHELAHTMANHITFRPDDHHSDFKWAEKLIAKYWN